MQHCHTSLSGSSVLSNLVNVAKNDQDAIGSCSYCKCMTSPWFSETKVYVFISFWHTTGMTSTWEAASFAALLVLVLLVGISHTTQNTKWKWDIKHYTNHKYSKYSILRSQLFFNRFCFSSAFCSFFAQFHFWSAVQRSFLC